MECKDIREKLSAYLEGSVSPEESRLIEEHLNSCQECRTSLEELKKAGELVKNLGEVEPPAWLTPKIMSRVRAEGEKKRGIFQKLFYPLHIKVPIEALATVLIAVTAVYVFRAVEPEMKLAHLPAPTEPMITRKEAPQPSKETAADFLSPGEKTAPKEHKERETDRVSAVPRGTGGEVIKKEKSLMAKEKETERESIALADAAKETRERKKLAAPPKLKEVAAIKLRFTDVSVKVKDVNVARGKVESLFGQLGAQKVERESREGKEVLTAELKAMQVKEFLEKLEVIGEINEKGIPLDTSAGDVAIRVEIVSIP